MACVTNEQFVYVPSATGEVEVLTTSTNPIALRAKTVGRCSLSLLQQYRIIEDRDLGWKVSTVAYAYTIAHEDEGEIAVWHWHPTIKVFTRPHIHIAIEGVGRKPHIPTGRVSVESVLRFALEDLGVAPHPSHRINWQEVLQDAETPFLQHRTWSTDPHIG